MRDVSSISNALRHRGAPFQRNSSVRLLLNCSCVAASRLTPCVSLQEHEMAVMGDSFPLAGFDTVSPFRHEVGQSRM
jgi:hypothetical protein